MESPVKMEIRLDNTGNNTMKEMVARQVCNASKCLIILASIYAAVFFFSSFFSCDCQLEQGVAGSGGVIGRWKMQAGRTLLTCFRKITKMLLLLGLPLELHYTCTSTTPQDVG